MDYSCANSHVWHGAFWGQLSGPGLCLMAQKEANGEMARKKLTGSNINHNVKATVASGYSAMLPIDHASESEYMDGRLN